MISSQNCLELWSHLYCLKAAWLSAALRVFSVALRSTGVPSTSRHMPCTENKQREQAVQHCKHKSNCLQGNNEKNSHGCRVRPCSSKHICPCSKLTVMDVESGRAALDIFVHAANCYSASLSISVHRAKLSAAPGNLGFCFAFSSTFLCFMFSLSYSTQRFRSAAFKWYQLFQSSATHSAIHRPRSALFFSSWICLLSLGSTCFCEFSRALRASGP
jgi:hypothetical protein